MADCRVLPGRRVVFERELDEILGPDAKALSRLGIRCFGFTPLRLPPGLDFSSLFHGVDERVPVDALHFGARVLDRFLRTC